MFTGFPYALIFRVCRHIECDVLEFLHSVAHGNAERNLLEHPDIIIPVTEDHGILRFHTQQSAQFPDAVCLVGRFDADVVVFPAVDEVQIERFNSLLFTAGDRHEDLINILFVKIISDLNRNQIEDQFFPVPDHIRCRMEHIDCRIGHDSIRYLLMIQLIAQCFRKDRIHRFAAKKHMIFDQTVAAVSHGMRYAEIFHERPHRVILPAGSQHGEMTVFLQKTDGLTGGVRNVSIQSVMSRQCAVDIKKDEFSFHVLIIMGKSFSRMFFVCNQMKKRR